MILYKMCLAIQLVAMMLLPTASVFGGRLKPTFVVMGDDTIVASAVVTDTPYNADPTGARDATTAIQQALDAVAALNGGVVYLPAGKYRLNGNLNLAYGVTIAGNSGSTARTMLLAYYGRGDADKSP